MHYIDLIPTRWGTMAAFKTDSYITPALHLYGDSTLNEILLALECIKPGDIVADVGANIGSFALPIAQRVGPKGFVHAFEPQHLAAMACNANLLINGVGEWCAVSNCALGDAQGMATIPLPDPRKKNNFGGARINDTSNVAGMTSTGSIEIPILPLDSIPFERLNFLKIDTEGHDAAVLRGARNTIMQHKPIIFCESLSEHADAELRGLLDSFGYRGWMVCTPLYSSMNARMVSHNIFGDCMSRDVIAFTKDQPKPDNIKDAPEL
jgi:FkbM family methyltransferase